MLTSPLISVIVPTYNRPDFLTKTLRSILAQTHQNLELIVVSNGVNPVNESVVKDLHDSRTLYVDQENSGGPSSPRNHGIRLARGKYVAFCDDDDLWLPEKLEKQIAAMEKDEQYGFSYTKMICFDETGREWGVNQKDRAATFNTMRYDSEVPISSVMVRADLLKQHGGFYEGPAVGAAEDYEFALRYAYHTSFVYIDEVLLRYWAGSNRTTAAERERKVSDYIRHVRDSAGCFWVFIREQKASPFLFLGPMLYSIKQNVKAFIYDTFVRPRLPQTHA